MSRTVTRNPIPPLAGSLAFTMSQLLRAMEEGNTVDFIYDGKLRVVEVHAIGLSTRGELVARGYQVAGLASRPLPQWTLFTLNKMELVEIKATASAAPREGYTQGDKQMSPVLVELAL